jgi:dTDP-4-dehydrorhamnose reductase
VKILLFGSRGQLGQALAQALNDSHDLYLSRRADCDLTITSQIEALIDFIKPDLIINAAAYTKVDAAEYNNIETLI